MEFVKPIPFAEAVDKIGRKTPIGSLFASDEWEQVPVMLRERAFFSATVKNVRFLQRAQDYIEDFLKSSRETVLDPTGNPTEALAAGSRAQFVKEMYAFAAREGMGPVDPKDAGTIRDIKSESRLQLIFETQTSQAHD